MFGNAWIIFLQVLPLFLMMGVRFVLGKCGMLTRTGTAELSRILLYVVTPCLIVDSFQMELDRETLRLVAVGCGALALCYVAYILLSRFFPCPSSVYSDSFALRLHLWKWYLYWHSTGGGGNRSGGGPFHSAVLFTVIGDIFCWTHGIVLMVGKE